MSIRHEFLFFSIKFFITTDSDDKSGNENCGKAKKVRQYHQSAVKNGQVNELFFLQNHFNSSVTAAMPPTH
jgi:hypothetical protein